VTPAARTLGEWAARLRAEDIPASVRDNAALRALDTIGCALAGAQEDHAPSVLALASRWGGPGLCTIWGTRITAAPPQAALAAGKSLGLDADRLTAALGIVASMASGVMEFLEDGSWVKRLQPGRGGAVGDTGGGARGRGLHRTGDGSRGTARLLPRRAW
jgi:2-methylcitrate dehydratase PrpD